MPFRTDTVFVHEGVVILGQFGAGWQDVALSGAWQRAFADLQAGFNPVMSGLISGVFV